MRPHHIAAIAGIGLLGFAALAGAKSELAEKMANSTGPAPSGSAHIRSVQDEMGEAFRKRRPKGPELEAKLAEVRATASARRAAHVAALRVRFDAAALHNKALVSELRAHARRVAFLNRAKFVATTEFDEPRRGKALTRIDQLMTRENSRHERKVQKIRLAGATPGASGVPSAAPAPSGSAQ